MAILWLHNIGHFKLLQDQNMPSGFSDQKPALFDLRGKGNNGRIAKGSQINLCYKITRGKYRTNRCQIYSMCSAIWEFHRKDAIKIREHIPFHLQIQPNFVT